MFSPLGSPLCLPFLLICMRRTRTVLEKKLAQTTAKSEEEKMSLKQHYSSTTKVGAVDYT